MATAEEPDTIDVRTKFIDILSDLMTEMNLTYDHYTKKEVDSMIKSCTVIYDDLWIDFLWDVFYGDDKKARTLALIRYGFNKRKIIEAFNDI